MKKPIISSIITTLFIMLIVVGVIINVPKSEVHIQPSSLFKVEILNVTDDQALAAEYGYNGDTFWVIYLNLTYEGYGTFSINVNDFYLYTTSGIFKPSQQFIIPNCIINDTELYHGTSEIGGIAFLTPNYVNPVSLQYGTNRVYFNITLPPPNNTIIPITITV